MDLFIIALFCLTIRHQARAIGCTRVNKNKTETQNCFVCGWVANQRCKRRAAILELIQQLIHTFCYCCSLTDFLMFYIIFFFRFLFCLLILFAERHMFRECWNLACAIWWQYVNGKTCNSKAASTFQLSRFLIRFVAWTRQIKNRDEKQFCSKMGKLYSTKKHVKAKRSRVVRQKVCPVKVDLTEGQIVQTLLLLSYTLANEIPSLIESFLEDT